MSMEWDSIESCFGREAFARLMKAMQMQWAMHRKRLENIVAVRQVCFGQRGVHQGLRWVRRVCQGLGRCAEGRGEWAGGRGGRLPGLLRCIRAWAERNTKV